MKTYRCNLFSNEPLKNGVSFNQIEILKWEKPELFSHLPLFYGVGICASTVAGININCEAILVIVAAG